MNLLVWWTKQSQAELVTSEQLESLPDYLQSEFDSRYGRGGRGRLWIHPELPDVSIPAERFSQSNLSDTFQQSAGIVFKAEDFNQLQPLPGFITDLNLIEIEHDPTFVSLNSTERGFARGEFTDLYGCKCSIQDSSLATESAIWLGINDAAPELLVPGKGWTKVEFHPDTLFHTRMHLNQQQASALIEVLQRFVETGSVQKVAK